MNLIPTKTEWKTTVEKDSGQKKGGLDFPLDPTKRDTQGFGIQQEFLYWLVHPLLAIHTKEAAKQRSECYLEPK